MPDDVPVRDSMQDNVAYGLQWVRNQMRDQLGKQRDSVSDWALMYMTKRTVSVIINRMFLGHKNALNAKPVEEGIKGKMR